MSKDLKWVFSPHPMFSPMSSHGNGKKRRLKLSHDVNLIKASLRKQAEVTAVSTNVNYKWFSYWNISLIVCQIVSFLELVFRKVITVVQKILENRNKNAPTLCLRISVLSLICSFIPLSNYFVPAFYFRGVGRNVGTYRLCMNCSNSFITRLPQIYIICTMYITQSATITTHIL